MLILFMLLLQMRLQSPEVISTTLISCINVMQHDTSD
jgi:hypothetical protein